MNTESSTSAVLTTVIIMTAIYFLVGAAVVHDSKQELAKCVSATQNVEACLGYKLDMSK